MVKKSDILNLFDQSGNLTSEAMERYLKGGLNQLETEQVRKHIEESEFEREALEGLRKHSSEQFSSEVKELNKRVKKLAMKTMTDPHPWISHQLFWKTAAGFALLIGLILVLYFVIPWKPVQQELAHNHAEIVKSDSTGNLLKIQDVSVAKNEIVPVTEQIRQLQVVDDDIDDRNENANVVNIVNDDVIVEAEVSEEIVPDETEDNILSESAMVMNEVVEAEDSESMIFMVVETMPEFPGGEAKLYEFIAETITYPQMAKESGIQGRVFVTFTIETDGSVKDARILRGIGGGCDEEALRIIKSMPKWIPGKQRGIPVRVQYNLPIKFTLE